MSKDQLFLLKLLAWILVCAVSWLYAAKGYSSWPRLDMWMFGCLFWVNFLIFGLYVSVLIVDAR